MQAAWSASGRRIAAGVAILASIIRLDGELRPAGVVRSGINWRVAAALVRRLNREAQRTGKPNRFVVDSPDMICAVAREDKFPWGNGLLLQSVGRDSIDALADLSAFDWIDSGNHAQMARRMHQVGTVATQRA